MRTEYIEQIKTFLRETPNFKDRMEEMRLKALISGATEEEFEAAVKEIAPDFAPTVPKKLRPFTKKLVAIDVVVHVLFIVFAVSTISLITTVMSGNSFPKFLSSAREPEKQKTAVTKPPELLPKVYANTATIDGAKVFSFPASDITLRISGTPKRKVFGFLPYWMIGQQERIDFTGLTTISFFGLEMDGGGNIVTGYADGQPDQGWVMWNETQIDAAIRRAKQQRIKTDITLKAFNNENIEKLVTSDEAQRAFIANAIYLINSKALDGVTLDFEYIGTPDPTVRDNFTRFVTNLRSEMQRHVPDATLSLATYVSAGAEKGFFDLQPLSVQVDQFVIMGYDFHTPKGNPGPVAPLEGTISIKSFIERYLEHTPPEKLILALAHYGYDWPIDAENKPLAPAGMLSYAEIAALTRSHSVQWQESTQTPFMQYTEQETSQQRIIHFENTRSLGLKYDYINEKNLGGVGIWALGYDGLNTDLRALLIEKFSK